MDNTNKDYWQTVNKITSFIIREHDLKAADYPLNTREQKELEESAFEMVQGAPSLNTLSGTLDAIRSMNDYQAAHDAALLNLAPFHNKHQHWKIVLCKIVLYGSVNDILRGLEEEPLAKFEEKAAEVLRNEEDAHQEAQRDAYE